MKGKLVFSIFIFSLFSGLILFAQDDKQEKAETRLTLSFSRNSDDSKTLKAIVFSKKERRNIPLTDVTVNFYIKSIENNLGNALTDEKGEAILKIPKEKDMVKDSLGNIILMARFNGDNNFNEVEEEITIKDTKLDLTLSIVDSVKTIRVTANEISADKEIPIEGVDIAFYVQRLFGNLKIGESTLEKGQCNISFPYNDLPGDSTGNVTIIVKIEENDDYGNVEKKSKINWGIPTSYNFEDIHFFLSSPFGVGTKSANNPLFLSLITVIAILIIITIVIYRRS